jgi:hypothetical protein
MGNTTHFKQILIDLDNYNALKELGKTGDSFNDVIRSLIRSNTNKHYQDMGYSFGNIVFGPNNKSFMLRIDSALRKLGVTFIECHKDYMTINFRGEGICNVYYPDNMDNLQESIESELRLRTELFESNIRTIGSYISDHGGQINSALKQI